MAAFLGLCLFIAFVAKPMDAPDIILAGLAVIAGMFLALLVWIDWRFINNIDEVLRAIRVQAMMIGIAVVLSLSAIWGFLELTTGVVALPIYYITVIYWVIYGLAATIITIRAARPAE